MNKEKQDTDTAQPNPEETTTEDTTTTTPETKEKEPQKSASNTTADDGPPPGYVSEESYKGLQKVVSKKDKELDDLKAKVDTFSTQLEELKSDTTKATETKGDLEKQLKEAQEKLSAEETNRDALEKQLSQQGIIMKEFPNLASVAQYIPTADDDDGYRENAKQFSEAMETFVKTGVARTIAGSTTPQPQSDDTVSETEEDSLWTEVYNLAGVPGKEKEYREAYDRLQKVLDTKNN